MAPQNYKLSVIVPVYKSEASLSLLIDRLTPALKQLAMEFEVLLINDASPDGSWRDTVYYSILDDESNNWLGKTPSCAARI